MTTSSRIAPTYFIISGFPKGGNKWLQKMVFDCRDVGGYSNNDGYGLPLMARMFLERETLQRLLKAEGVPMERFTIALIDPDAPVELSLSSAGREKMQALLHELALDSAKISPHLRPIDRFRHVLDRSAKPAMDRSQWKAIGLPAMHTPIPLLRKLVPSFRIVNILRDPRDVTISFFYHLLATLNTELTMQFVRRNKRSGRLEQHPRWKKLFANRIRRRLRAYYGQHADLQTADVVHRVRYEDLLSSPIDELRSTLRFLGCDERDEALAAIVKNRSFESATGSTQEQRNSMIRKGKAGDWQNYFDRELLDHLGDDFISLVRELGYEHDDAWAREVPDAAPKQFDFARFRIRRSTTRQFIRLWDESEELQHRYPDSWQDIEGEDCFYSWLETCDDPEVRKWLALAHELQELWQVDIVEKAGR